MNKNTSVPQPTPTPQQPPLPPGQPLPQPAQPDYPAVWDVTRHPQQSHVQVPLAHAYNPQLMVSQLPWTSLPAVTGTSAFVQDQPEQAQGSATLTGAATALPCLKRALSPPTAPLKPSSNGTHRRQERHTTHPLPSCNCTSRFHVDGIVRSLFALNCSSCQSHYSSSSCFSTSSYIINGTTTSRSAGPNTILLNVTISCIEHSGELAPTRCTLFGMRLWGFVMLMRCIVNEKVSTVAEGGSVLLFR
ncbi:hypothetical protein M378DRAFT_395594 [Amanita muscaria Koide BX008]|uniref:Uncharacterized protein n=1 Tax=Amanita muscaria (strain Koide BX008) TaxID=946122 RepID=A0A0C2S3S3_AMAMK|nr:hypothetical protein M378DRAFT_395594 [Amanita muscaria Koide BX008]